MDILIFLLILSSVVWSFFSVYRRKPNLPPGPFPFPIVGNMFLLGPIPHLSLDNLSKIYGPIMRIKIGTMQTIVVSSPDIAKVILTKYDQVCAGRPVPYATEALNHNQFSIAWLPPGNKWRMHRKICKEYLFATHKMQATEGLRQERLQLLRSYIAECSRGGKVVNIKDATAVTLLNMISATLFSMGIADYNSTASQEMRKTIQDILRVTGEPNPADYFPILKVFDPKGIKQRMKVNYVKVLGMLDDIINERLQELKDAPDSPRKTDMLQVLLDLNQENYAECTLTDIKHLLLDLVNGAGTTTSEFTQWAMAELLRDPEKTSKVRDELMTVVGKDKLPQESDIPKLSYLNAFIKETFRYHPSGPLLAPHRAEADVEVNGYMIPKGATVIFNTWTIGRDPRIWENPNSFQPERFLGSKVDYKGQDYELFPFGSGRRICPGMPLAHTMAHLILASMIHGFEWKIEGVKKPQELDMSEAIQLFSVTKAVPLMATPHAVN